MRIKNLDDVENLGKGAQRQIKKALEKQGGFHNQKRFDSSIEQIKKSHPDTPKAKVETKKQKPSRVMTTDEGLSYCPWPSTDPFVIIHQLLEKKYGLYEHGGRLVTEMIITGGEKAWRFDFALLPTLSPSGNVLYGDPVLLIESDGFKYHKSLDAFKNDRRKQTHALRSGCLLKRITNEDARLRLTEFMEDIEEILLHQRVYLSTYQVKPKGKTQCVFCWNNEPTSSSLL